ncbi:MAG: tetratricopeptide repeat protein, partial [Candidatus Acidiferrum sp.]
MAYNKSKFVEAAQKLLNQGKVAQAIAEYQQILKFEPRDQVTLMTVGELYIRQGETFQAIDYFERLAQIFVSDGFLTKAIAVYKRIAKLAPEEIRPLEKLADLYVQQGVMSEARPLFLQLAEIHLKNNRQPEAVSLLRKLLLAEPDNLRIQVRLADLYQAMGQAKEAMDTYVSAAQRALARGDHAECEKLADKALKLDPHNLAAVIVKARSYSARGNAAQAAETLENVPNLEKGGEQAELLLDLYIKSTNWEKATQLALRIFEADEKNFGLTQKLSEALLQSDQGEKAMAIIERTRIPMLDAGEHEAVSRLLNELVVKLPGRIEPHDWLVDSYGRTSDSFRLPDALAQLGDALVADGQLDRAKGVFEQLVDREPDSDSAKRKLNDLLQKMGIAPAEEDASSDNNLKTYLQPLETPKIRPDLDLTASENLSQADAETRDASVSLDEETQKFISQSLTDVDLFASYGLTQKAIGLLEAILRRAPRHTPTIEKLLDFVLGAGDDRRTAELAARLEKLHGERGDQRAAERFAELRRRFQRAAGLSDADLAAASEAALAEHFPVAAGAGEDIAEGEELAAFEVAPDSPAAETPATTEPVPVEVAARSSVTVPEDVQEVDLSDEWLSVLKEVAPEEPAAEVPVVHEINDEDVHAPAAVEFEIAPEPVPVENASSAPAHLESVHSSSPFVPPSDMPAYAEFQVTPEAPTPIEEPVAEAPVASSEVAAPEEPAPAEAVPNVVEEFIAETPVEALEPVSTTSADEPAYELPAEPVAEELPALEEITAPEVKEEIPELAPVELSHAPEKIAAPQEEPEFELDQDYELILDSEPLVPAYDQKAPDVLIEAHHEEPEPVHASGNSSAPPAGSGFASDQFLADLASEI